MTSLPWPFDDFFEAFFTIFMLFGLSLLLSNEADLCRFSLSASGLLPRSTDRDLFLGFSLAVSLFYNKREKNPKEEIECIGGDDEVSM